MKHSVLIHKYGQKIILKKNTFLKENIWAVDRSQWRGMIGGAFVHWSPGRKRDQECPPWGVTPSLEYLFCRTLVNVITNHYCQGTSLLQLSNFRFLQHFHWSWNCLYLSMKVTARGKKELRGPSELHRDVGANDGRTSREVKWPPQALGQRGWTTRTDSMNHQDCSFAAANEKQVCWCFWERCYMTFWSWGTTGFVSY